MINIFNIELRHDNEILTCCFKKNLTFKQIYLIDNYLIPLVLKYKINNLVIDLTKVERIDKTFINTLIKLKLILKINKGKLIILNVPNIYKEEFKVRKLKIKA